jgi:hypothetical protein
LTARWSEGVTWSKTCRFVVSAKKRRIERAIVPDKPVAIKSETTGFWWSIATAAIFVVGSPLDLLNDVWNPTSNLVVQPLLILWQGARMKVGFKLERGLLWGSYRREGGEAWKEQFNLLEHILILFWLFAQIISTNSHARLAKIVMPFGETTNSTVNAKERGCGDVFKKIKFFFY